jgi:hypothetical protein
LCARQNRQSSGLSLAEVTVECNRYYVALSVTKHALTKGLELMVADGTFTQVSYIKQTLLLAVTYDGNNQLFVVAFALTDIENGDNWLWFMKKLLADFPGIEVSIADYDKGIEAHEFQQALTEKKLTLSFLAVLATWLKTARETKPFDVSLQ